LNLPVVLIDYLISSPKASTILTNNYHGGRIAVEHLIDYGHRQIGFVGGDINHPSIGDRLRGYRDALQAASIPADHALISTAEPSTAVDDGYNATRRLNQTGRGFTAIFAVNDIMAVGAMRCLHEAGRKVPEDVSIIGFDDIEVCLHVQPHLSTVRVFKEELGAIAVRRLVENIQTKRNMVSQVVVQVELVIRDSTRKLNP
jgi:DNA-binding LacI/PurR family transcriptional regulator